MKIVLIISLLASYFVNLFAYENTYEDYQRDLNKYTNHELIDFYTNAMQKNLPMQFGNTLFTGVSSLKEPPFFQYFYQFNFTKYEFNAELKKSEIKKNLLKKICYRDAINFYFIQRGIGISISYSYYDGEPFFLMHFTKDDCKGLN